MKNYRFLLTFIFSLFCATVNAQEQTVAVKKAPTEHPLPARPSRSVSPSFAKPPTEPSKPDSSAPDSEIGDSDSDISDGQASSSDEEEEPSEPDYFPTEPFDMPIKELRQAAQLAYNDLGDEEINADNLGQLLFDLKHKKYRKVTALPDAEKQTISLELKESAAKEKAEDTTINLTEQETAALNKAFNDISTRGPRKPGGGKGGNVNGSNDDDDDPYDDDDDDEKDTQKRRPQRPTQKIAPEKRSTPESRDRRLNPQRYNNQPRRYNPRGGYYPRSYNPRSSGKFTPQKQPVKKPTIIEGKPRLQDKKKTPVKKETLDNKQTRNHARSRVPEAQQGYKKRIYPSPQNVDHERRTQKVERMFKGLPEREQKESHPQATTQSNVEKVDQNSNQTFFEKVTNWFEQLWESFKSLLGWN